MKQIVDVDRSTARHGSSSCYMMAQNWVIVNIQSWFPQTSRQLVYRLPSSADRFVLLEKRIAHQWSMHAFEPISDDFPIQAMK